MESTPKSVAFFKENIPNGAVWNTLAVLLRIWGYIVFSKAIPFFMESSPKSVALFKKNIPNGAVWSTLAVSEGIGLTITKSFNPNSVVDGGDEGVVGVIEGTVVEVVGGAVVEVVVGTVVEVVEGTVVEVVVGTLTGLMLGDAVLLGDWGYISNKEAGIFSINVFSKANDLFKEPSPKSVALFKENSPKGARLFRVDSPKSAGIFDGMWFDRLSDPKYVAGVRADDDTTSWTALLVGVAGGTNAKGEAYCRL